MLSLFRDVLENDSVKKIGQNCKFDIQVLRNYNIRVSGPLFDTMVAHYLLQPEGRHNMNYLAETYLAYRPVSIEDLIGGRGNLKNLCGMFHMKKSGIMPAKMPMLPTALRKYWKRSWKRKK